MATERTPTTPALTLSGTMSMACSPSCFASGLVTLGSLETSSTISGSPVAATIPCRPWPTFTPTIPRAYSEERP